MSVAERAARVGDAVRVARTDGLRGLGARAVRVAHQRLGVAALDFPLRPEDVADSGRLHLAAPPVPPARGAPLHVAWLTTPPSPGSGGHTTMFRMVQALEQAGHVCEIVLYDRFGGRLDRHTAAIRAGWPDVRATVRDIADTPRRTDAWIATGWQTAHVLATRVAQRTRRLYFVQDYEPFFFPRGSEYALAEDTYRFGFRCIAVGHMVADLLAQRTGVRADVAPFGCDNATYRLLGHAGGNRSGVVFYTKPDVARRGYRLGVLALAEFHRRHPEHPIHVFGAAPDSFASFPVRVHGNLTPAGLNALYNRTVAGLALSFTNISLVAQEMLAAGTIPVVNDSPYTRADLADRHVRWAAPTPGAVADQLCAAVENPDGAGAAAAAARDVPHDGWRAAQAVVVAAVEDEVYGDVPRAARASTSGEQEDA